MTRVILITYGTQDYNWTLDRICREADETGWFSEVHALGPADVPSSYRSKLSEILSMKRGGGYWIWKPLIVREFARRLSDGDVLIYADAGCHINPEGDFESYRKLLNRSSTGAFAFQTPFVESCWTHPDVFSYFDVAASDVIRNTGMYMATVLPFRICDQSRSLIDVVCEVVDKEPRLFTDMPASDQQPDGFQQHRHDQSIWSVARKLDGSRAVPDNTWSKDWNRLLDVPIQARRIRGEPVESKSTLRNFASRLFRRSR